MNGYWKELGQNKEVAEVAHVRLTEYRWWVHLWSESDGIVEVQTEKFALAYYYPFVRKLNKGSLALYEFFRESKSADLKAVTARQMGKYTQIPG